MSSFCANILAPKKFKGKTLIRAKLHKAHSCKNKALVLEFSGFEF